MLQSIIVPLIVGAVVGALVVVANLLSAASCEATAKAMKVEYSYGLLAGCIVTIDGRPMPLKNYRGVTSDP